MARNPRLEADMLSLATSETLSRALEQTPATRAEKVAQARSLVEDVTYPPLELIKRISALIAPHLRAQDGPNQESSD